MSFPTLVGLVLGLLGLFSLGNGIFTIWRSSSRRTRWAVVAGVVPQATHQILHLDVEDDRGTVRVPARRPLQPTPVEVGQRLEVVLDGRRKIAWIGGPPRSLRVLGIVSIVLGTLLVLFGASLTAAGASL